MKESLVKKSLNIWLLQLLLAVYSVSGIFSKMAAGQPFMSGRFCAYYAIVILLLGIYAVGWQQAIKCLPLTTAYANKAVTVVWGMVWGILFFAEPVTIGKAAGALLVITGIVVYAGAGEKEEGGQYRG